MNDVANQQAVSMGNARNSSVRDLNERIKQHNTDVANSISQQMDQNKTTQQILQTKDLAQGLWVGAKMPDKVKAYNDYVDSKKASNPTTQVENAQRSTLTEPLADATTPEQLPTTPPAEAIAEGAPNAESVVEANEASGSRLVNGLRKTGAFSDEALDTMGKAGGKLASGAGILGAAAIGGLDVYQDFKAGGLAGNNNWEKAGNVLQIGGAIADVAGAVFPPAALIGGVLDLTAGALDEVGQATDTASSKQLDAVKAAETESQVSAPQQIQSAGIGLQ